MREVRRLYADKVRSMCIENEYYTAGSCEEYAEMLNACHVDNPPTDYYQMIAEDIWEHSDQEAHTMGTGLSEDEMIKCLMFELINNCSVTHIEDM